MAGELEKEAKAQKLSLTPQQLDVLADRVAASEGKLIDRVQAVLPSKQNIWNVAGNTTAHVADTLVFDPLKKTDDAKKTENAEMAQVATYVSVAPENEAPEYVAATQASLGALINRPKLTAPLLQKPPFRFLHDIVSQVMRTYGFADGLYDEDELNSAKIKDKDSKLKYLSKIISVVELSAGTQINIRPDKVVAGLEPENTNAFLVMLAQVATSGADHTTAVQETLAKFSGAQTEAPQPPAGYAAPDAAAMAGRVRELQGTIQKFSARWFELKPKKLDTKQHKEMMQVIARVKEWQSEFEEVSGAATKLVMDCEQFSIEPPQLVGLEDVRADVEAYVEVFAVFEEYMADLDKLAQEDWISFRQRFDDFRQRFDDFIGVWVEKSRACPPGTVADHMRGELSRFRDVGPLLQYVRGEAFKAEHWATLFKWLGLDKSLTIGKLCFSHFLDAARALIDRQEEVRQLNTRAVGEEDAYLAIKEFGPLVTYTEIDDFVKESMEALKESMEALSRRPESFDEIDDATRPWTEIVGRMDAVRVKFMQLELLDLEDGSVSRNGLDLAALTSRWEELGFTHRAYIDRIKDQMSHLLPQMDGRVSKVQGTIQKFSARWFELKPKKLDTNQRKEMMQVIARVKEWQSEFEEVSCAADKLVMACEHFAIAPPQFFGLEDVKADIDSCVSACAVLEECLTELDKLAQEDWISFRQRLWEFDDFIGKWEEKSRAGPPGPNYLRDALSSFRDVVPLLQHVRGEAFQAEHWATLLKTLGLDKSLKIDDLCFSHFLDAAQALIDHEEEVRQLNARALGEADECPAGGRHDWVNEGHPLNVLHGAGQADSHRCTKCGQGGSGWHHLGTPDPSDPSWQYP